MLSRSPLRATAGAVRVARTDAPVDDPDAVAVAFAVSRRHGSAVRRNRIRRRLRAAAVELVRSGLVSPGTYLISPRNESSAEMPFDELRGDLADALGRLAGG
jgi:ribonuclease P protein component